MTTGVLRFFLAAFLALGGKAAAAGISVVDDAGRTVTLKGPARRIVSLAPHLTELLFAAGAPVVGTVEYSDFPEAAKRVPRIGDSAQLDLERVVALRPDLIVIWQHGNAQRQLNALLQLGIPAFYNQPNRLADIGRGIERFGRLAGTESVALPAVRAFAAREAELRARYAGRSPVSIFFQIWERPLMTVNGDHLISDVIRLCGGRNVFGDMRPLASSVSTEAVLEADPDAIGGTTGEVNTTGRIDQWNQWPRLKAVARGNLFVIPSDLISRHSPRILDGVQQMCEYLEAARARGSK